MSEQPQGRGARLRTRAAASLRPEVDDRPLVETAAGLTLRQVVVRFWPRLRPMRWWLLLAGVMLLLTALIEVAEIMLFERVVDDALVPAQWQPLIWLALVYVGLNLLSAVVSGGDDYLNTWISQRFLLDLRTDAFAHTLSLPLDVHHRRRLGDVLSRLTSDVSAVESFMVGQLSTLVESVVRLVVFCAALLYLDWRLALASFVVVPVFWWVSSTFGDYVRRIARERRRRSGSMGAVTEEHLSNGALVQAYNREAEAVEDYQRQNRAILAAELAGSRVRSLFLPLVDLTELLGTLVVLGLGVHALQQDRLTLGGLLAFLTLLTQCHRPVRELAELLPSMYAATAGIERLVELLDEEPPRDRPGAVPLVAPRGEVRFEGVSARYPEAVRDALGGFDATFAPGEVVALTGPSGAGKSTATRLLTRHLDAREGRVLLDGRPIEEWTIASVRDAVTVVLQETLLLDASVADNLAFARPGATREEILTAARAADAHDFVERLPAGYDTRIGQRGRSLSGGQRQRLALARALLRESPVLLLDEPTTGLDEASARRVLAPLREAARTRTVVLVTHDPVALGYADRVVHLDPGSPGDGAEPGTDPGAGRLLDATS